MQCSDPHILRSPHSRLFWQSPTHNDRQREAAAAAAAVKAPHSTGLPQNQLTCVSVCACFVPFFRRYKQIGRISKFFFVWLKFFRSCVATMQNPCRLQAAGSDFCNNDLGQLPSAEPRDFIMARQGLVTSSSTLLSGLRANQSRLDMTVRRVIFYSVQPELQARPTRGGRWRHRGVIQPDLSRGRPTQSEPSYTARQTLLRFNFTAHKSTHTD